MSFYLFIRYFLSSRSNSLIRLISWLCLTGVAVSIASLIMIVSVMEGLGKAVKSRLLAKQAHLRIQYDQKLFSDISPTLDKSYQLFDSKPLPDFLSQSLSIKQKKGIQSVQTFEIQELILKTTKGFKGVSAKGYDKVLWNRIKEVALEEDKPVSNSSPQALPPEQNPSLKDQTGRLDVPNSSLLEQNSPAFLPIEPAKGVLISHSLSLETGLGRGDEVIFVPIMGLLLPEGMPPPAKIFKVWGAVSMDSATSVYYQQGEMDFGSFSQVNYQSEIQLNEPETVLEYQSLFKSYKVKNWMEENSNLFFALKLEKLIMTLFFIISLVISCLGISSSLLLLMTQKGEDIAILQAMGMSRKDIIKNFTRIGLHLSGSALLLGGIFGLSFVLFLKFNRINILPALYQDRTVPADFLPLDYTFIFLGAGLISYIFCYLPTRYFSRINVVSLLKRTHF